MPKDISAVGVGALATGVLLVYSGLKGSSVLGAVQDIIKGQRPSGSNVNPIDSTALGSQAQDAAGVGFAGAVGAAIVAKAMTHRGRHPYRYGAGHGAWNCGAGTPQDCSGFVSCVLHELGVLNRPLNTTGFLAWSGAVTVPWEQRAAGDLIIWPQHMGIAISPTQMIHTGGQAGCPCVVPYTRTRFGRVGVARRVRGGT